MELDTWNYTSGLETLLLPRKLWRFTTKRHETSKNLIHKTADSALLGVSLDVCVITRGGESDGTRSSVVCRTILLPLRKTNL